MRRIAKQLTYGLLYVIVFVGIPIGIYYALLKPAPTCFDGVENGEEQGIDCGGVCAQACIPATLKPINVAEGLKLIPIDTEHASIFAEVVNANPDFAAWNFGYIITLEGEAPESVRTFEGISYIYGGEVKTLAFPNTRIGSAPVRAATIEFRNPQWIPSDSWKRPMFRVQHVTTRREEGMLITEGEFWNEDTSSFRKVEVVAVFRGQFGEVVGVSRTEVVDAAPAAYRAFSVRHPDIPDADVGKTLVELHAFRE